MLPVDDEGRVLLLHGWDPHRPEEPFWFTVGGAADEGESLRDAGRPRTLRGDPHRRSNPERLGEPIAENAIEFSWGGHHIAQDQTFYAVAVGSAEVSLEGLDQWERATTDKYGWLSAEDLEADERPARSRHPGPDPHGRGQRPLPDSRRQGRSGPRDSGRQTYPAWRTRLGPRSVEDCEDIKRPR